MGCAVRSVRLAVRSLSGRTMFEARSDEFTVKVTDKTEEVKALLETGFEYVRQKDSLIFLRKRKWRQTVTEVSQIVAEVFRPIVETSPLRPAQTLSFFQIGQDLLKSSPRNVRNIGERAISVEDLANYLQSTTA